MKNHLTVLLVTTLFATSAWAVEKPEKHNGQQLHDNSCLRCHKTEVYTRADRHVKSLSALSTQVENCMTGPAGADWSPAQTKAVVDYLNSKFYKF